MNIIKIEYAAQIIAEYTGKTPQLVYDYLQGKAAQGSLQHYGKTKHPEFALNLLLKRAKEKTLWAENCVLTALKFN